MAQAVPAVVPLTPTRSRKRRGGMLAVRFGLMYPGTVTHLVLENPIGLEE